MGTTQPDYTGQMLDNRYLVEKKLASGGMGAVYQGRHVAVGRKVAIKFLHEDFANNEEVIKRFYREAQAAAAIAHKNIIDVWDVGISPSGNPYLTMEYLEGESLAALIAQNGQITLPAACAILEPVLLAIGAAHEKGFVHRDLKPENIFFAHVTGEDQPVIKIIDFGISKFSGDAGFSKITKTGSMLGTPSYMAPEQIRGDKELDTRADIYAVGVILYEMLTGKLPFTGEHHNALIINVLTENPIPPAEAYPDFPIKAESLLMRLLAKNPDERPNSAEALLKEIRQLATSEQRAEHLSRYATSITNSQCAAGDLGEETPGSSKSAQEILVEVSRKSSMPAWADSQAPSTKRSKAPGLGIVLSLMAITGVAVFLLTAQETEPTPIQPAASQPTASRRAPNESLKTQSPVSTAVPPAASPGKPSITTLGSETVEIPAPAPVPKTVEIALVGVPVDAKVEWDGKRETKNPFTVPLTEKPVPLRIVAPGHEVFLKQVVPNEDRRIAVALIKEKPAEETASTVKEEPKKPAPADAEKSDKKKPVESVEPKRREERKPSEASEKQKLLKGGRGIKYIKGFD